jgi:hypothetical protein
VAKAKAAAAVDGPGALAKKAFDSTADVIRKEAKRGKKAVSNAVTASSKSASRGIYGIFYYPSYTVTYSFLTLLYALGENPITHGIKDGAADAAKAKGKKRRVKKK